MLQLEPPRGHVTSIPPSPRPRRRSQAGAAARGGQGFPGLPQRAGPGSRRWPPARRRDGCSSAPGVRGRGQRGAGAGASMWSGQAPFKEGSQQLQKQPAVGQWKPLASSSGGKELPQLDPRCREAGGGDDQSTAQLNVSRLRSSSVEIREKGSEFLKEELHRAQKELKLKDEECERLSKVREQLEQELEELTASLFEEAHKMVRDANTKQAASEKQLREARGKIDMLQAEVTALKTLVITSTPSSPNRELHPQLQSPSKTVFRKGHGRNKSASSAVVTATSQSLPVESVSNECKELAAGRLHPIRRVPSLEGIPDSGKIVLLPGEDLPGRCGALPGLHQTGAIRASAGGRGAEHAHHRARGYPGTARGEGVGDGMWRTKRVPVANCNEVRSEWPFPSLQTPHQAGGFWELLLHLTILPGQDHSRMQLLHLHSLHPAGLGETGCGADVLGNHAAQEGNVHG
ncbi:guanine nucleotide exchange factor for Rab-3A isoform X4 [Trachemys scripta elegans]|uniref:guanine nucleotide exchange factor for Rab-3A isoform X4 n=1 Tax=Trachemys scripta elegans TaxID=31138 RepID=UPI001554FB53|nr:guanine nucleotide exchange factor for Rab-3A isoform X4 [Trachemys scripta elegans]